MKMKKLARVFTSAVLVSAMVATMGGMTSFAAVESIPLTKTVTTDGNTYAPITEFSFTIANGAKGTLGEGDTLLEATEDGRVPEEALGAVVYGGDEADGALEIVDDADFSFGPSKKSMENVSDKYTRSSTIRVRSDKFTKPGIYHYTIAENIPEHKYDGIVYDEDVRDVYVYVVNKDGGGYEVSNVIVAVKGKKQGENVGTGENGIKFVNNYGKDKDDNNEYIPEGDTTHDLTVKKTVSGNQGNKNATFNFTVSVKGAEENEQYKLVMYDGGTEMTSLPDGVPTFLTSGANPVTIPLGDGQSFRIYGLSENDECNVVEQSYVSDGYETIYAGVASAALESTKIMDDNSILNVENKKNVTTPTGIVLSFAPYILLVAFAGVFGVLFLRRKKEEF